MIDNTPAAWSRRAADAETSWEASGWSQLGQLRRFERVREYLDLRAGDLLLDYGCGDGAFSLYMSDGVRYYGVDTAEGMLKRARREHPAGVYRNGLAASDVFEHVVCIGTFNLADQWSREQTWDVVERLWKKHTRRMLAVSLYAGADPETLDYSPSWVLSLAQTLSPCYVIDRSYLSNDVLLVVKR